jgi:hypothetical protein
MSRFHADNAWTYTPAERAAMNAEFARRVAAKGLDIDADDLCTLSALDNLAEQIIDAADRGAFDIDDGAPGFEA